MMDAGRRSKTFATAFSILSRGRVSVPKVSMRRDTGRARPIA